jgi:hypothetical protein
MSVACVCVCVCGVRYRSLRQADHSSRGVLRSVLCLIVCALETSTVRRPRAGYGCYDPRKISILRNETRINFTFVTLRVVHS